MEGNAILSKRYLHAYFIEVVLTKTKKQNQSRCPWVWVGKWIKKNVFICISTHTQTHTHTHTHTHTYVCMYVIQYYSDIKRMKFCYFAATWMELEVILLSEISQTQKEENHLFSLIYGNWTVNLRRMNRIVITRDWKGSGVRKKLDKGHQIQLDRKK
jgi:hypothetical protein